MTRLESGPPELARDWTSMGEIVATVLERHGERLTSHRVILEIPADLPLVRVDAALLEQALGNLVENAARHTPAGTVVRIRAAAASGELVVTVEDYGGGIAPGEVEAVFAKFHRGAPQSAGGMGLGLAICRTIVRLHGGRAWAEHVSEGGTAFHIALPLERAPAVPREEG